MKRWICVLLCACLLLTLAACGGITATESDPSEAPEETESSALSEDSSRDTSSEQAQVRERDAADVQQTEYEYEIREMDCTIGSQSIYGLAYIPETDGTVPLVIFAHELGSTHRSGTEYAEELASRGIATYTFDFRGGSTASRSDGSTVGMSVMTEAADVEAVLDAAKEWDFVDSGRIALIGASQGGMASAVAASRRPDEIAGLILLYPALLVHDAVHEQFDSLDEVPEQFYFNGWINVGKNYVSDVWDYDVYAEMPNYTSPVLILHGDRDGIVDVSYAQRAAESYPDAELHILHGAGHGFYGSSFDTAMSYILDYLSEIGFLA